MAAIASAPLIGMCAHVGPMNLSVYDMPAMFVPRVFVDLVSRAGGVPVLLPPVADAPRAVAALDGLLLLPGPDVDPGLYGAAAHAQSRYHRERDLVELEMLASALDTGIPTLGICRGLQLLNTRYGGTLHQHLPEILGNDEHQPGETDFGLQSIVLESGTRIFEILQTERYTVPCHHHQAIDRLGTALEASARASDGVIEAIELPGHPFAVAVQWHAEKSDDARLFNAFIQAARRFAGAGVR